MAPSGLGVSSVERGKRVAYAIGSGQGVTSGSGEGE